MDFDEKVKEVKDILAEHNVSLKPARTYLQALPQPKAEYGEKGIESQLNRILANIHPQNKEERLAKKQIEDVLEGREPREKLEETGVEGGKMSLSEEEFGDISFGFEEFTENKIPKDSDKLGWKGIDYDDFKRYADKLGVPVEKVLAANPWTKETLTDMAKEKVEKAKEKVELEF